jgi:hypothetical protein
MTSPRVTHPVLYRVYQFFAALKATLPPWVGGVQGGLTTEDEGLVTSTLKTPIQQQLFARMSPHDRRHALAVVRTLQAAGYHQTALMQAALLHDVGKSMGQPLLHRVLIVLLEAFWPAGLRWLSGELAVHPSIQKVSWWRRPFVIHAQHPMIGATWAEEAACEPLAVRLIARHQEILSRSNFRGVRHAYVPNNAARGRAGSSNLDLLILGGEPVSEEEKLLAALQWADNLN